MAKVRDGRGGSRSGEGGEETEVPLSDPQELLFYPAREGRVWRHAEIETGVRDAARCVRELHRSAGSRIWLLGDALRDMYFGWAERVAGQPTFKRFALERLDIDEDEYWEALRVRRRIDAEETAEELGRKRLQLGLRLLDALQIETFETLRKTDLPQPDGTTIRFPARVRQLQAALKLVKVANAPDESPTSRRAAKEAGRRNEAFGIATQEDQTLAGIRHAKYYVFDNDVLLKTSPLTLAQSVALARFVLKLER